jgi:hypothetical protein
MGGGNLAASAQSPFSSNLPLDQKYIYFDKVKAIADYNKQAVKPSIE